MIFSLDETNKSVLSCIYVKLIGHRIGMELNGMTAEEFPGTLRGFLTIRSSFSKDMD